MAAFDQYPYVDQTPNPTPEVQSSISGKWNEWLSAPENRAALMQFGVNLMSPMGVGQTNMGHLGQALGSAGEALSKNVASQRVDEQQDIVNRRAKRAQDLEAEDVISRRTSANRGGLFSPYQSARISLDEQKAFNDFLTKAAKAQEFSPEDQAIAQKALSGDAKAIAQMKQIYQQLQTQSIDAGQENPAGTEGVAPSGATDPRPTATSNSGRTMYQNPDGRWSYD